MQINKFEIAIAKSSSSCAAQSENYSLCTFFHLKITAAHFLLCAFFRRRRRFVPIFISISNTHSRADWSAYKQKPIFMQRRSADVKLRNNFNFHETSIIIKFCIIWSNPAKRSDGIEKEFTNITYELRGTSAALRTLHRQTNGKSKKTKL